MLVLPKKANGKVQLDISDVAYLEPLKNASAYLSVFVKQEQGEFAGVPIQGKYTIEGDYLSFSPHFPFESGVPYLVKTKEPDSTNGYSYKTFQIGKKEAVQKACVERIYPSASQLPENLLRFYIYFKTPMKTGQALKYIRLVDSFGNVDTAAFMEFKQELWSADGKRLTLLFDPGRIKRGVSTNRELGPALVVGNQYHLTILKDWQDAYGQPLLEETQKHFMVSRAYRNGINIHEWALDKPKGDLPLILHFNRIIDHALLQSMIQIKDQENNLVAGHWEILENEKSIRFIHEKKWQNGSYKIVFHNRLEDVAGNNLHGLLDEKVKPDRQSKKKASFLKFILD